MTRPAPAVQRLGPVRAVAAPESVAAFRRATGWEAAAGPPPASFPVIVMHLPEIGDAVRAAAEEVGMPVHEAQHFEYSRPIGAGESYDLMIEMRRETEPARLIVSADVFALDGVQVGRIVSTLRLIDPKTVASAAGGGARPQRPSP
jgi:hypothetical protein